MEVIVELSGAAEEELVALRKDFPDNLKINPTYGLLDVSFCIPTVPHLIILTEVSQNNLREVLRDFD